MIHIKIYLLNFRGRPPYPIVEKMTLFELDHITNWLDSYQTNEDLSLNPIMGHLQEFRDQQELGVTTFKLPPRKALWNNRNK